MTTCSDTKTDLESYFSAFRSGITGQLQLFESPFGLKKIHYADWTASGRAYRPIEECLQKQVLPFMANTHTAATVTGTLMSDAYRKAREIIKGHVNAGQDDALIFCGSGMTSAVNKLQRILGIRIPERVKDYMNNGHEYTDKIDPLLKPIVFITEMEHHSNQVSWLETIADLENIPCGENGQVDLGYFSDLLEKYKCRRNKIAAVTACSNVTGIRTPYPEIAAMIHRYDGLCFVDFAGSAPYAAMNMHPQQPGSHLDAIYFSPHKFLGGPGTAGVLIFSKKLYTNQIPDQPGGGTVNYSNPWKEHDYSGDVEEREDGGTPPILQGIKAAMCVRLKEQMGIENMLLREGQLLRQVFRRFSQINNARVLQGNVTGRLGIVSFIIEGAHHNLVVKLLNDRFGIQVRGGCSCAGTYGHRLLQVDKNLSYKIRESIRSGNLAAKPGWIRLSIHPTMSTEEINYIMDGITVTAARFDEWEKDYCFDAATNEFFFKGFTGTGQQQIEQWYNASGWL